MEFYLSNLLFQVILMYPWTWLDILKSFQDTKNIFTMNCLSYILGYDACYYPVEIVYVVGLKLKYIR